MLRSMLVGLDGSAFSTAAAELGLAWAQKFSCRLTALGIIDEPDIRRPQAVPIGGAVFKSELDEARMIEARQRIDQFLADFAIRATKSNVTYRVLENAGSPHEQISLEAQRHDLVLLGQETYFHFETQQTSGDTLERVLKSTPRPVVAVPQAPRPGSGTLIAFDGSLQSARALQLFVATGLASADEVRVISIDADSESQAGEVADRALEFLTAHGIHATAHPIVSRQPAGEIIVGQAHQLNAELIVMGCFGQSSWREFLLGSATRDVLRASDLPLFLYH